MVPYYQFLYDIPYIKNSTSSLLNVAKDWFENNAYINGGKGRNYGIDFTLEKYIDNGLYYLFTASVFNSEYKTDTNTWYNTRFNRSYLANFLIGKEYVKSLKSKKANAALDKLVEQLTKVNKEQRLLQQEIKGKSKDVKKKKTKAKKS